MIPLSDCIFEAEANNRGQFVGRCRQFPDMRTRPHKKPHDAIDDIFAQVAEKIRYRDEAADNIRRGY